VTLTPGTHELGPAQGTLRVKTFREGVAAKVGHDLIIDVGEWTARVAVGAGGAIDSVELTAAPRSLSVREGLRGVKPLSDGDRADIRRTVDEKVLRGQPIAFRSSAVEVAGGAVTVRGALTLGGETHATSFALTVGDDGRLTGAATVRQSEWGIRPYRGLMGALKVRDDVEVAVDARLPAA
jgi:hypothetical protein